MIVILLDWFNQATAVVLDTILWSSYSNKGIQHHHMSNGFLPLTKHKNREALSIWYVAVVCRSFLPALKVYAMLFLLTNKTGYTLQHFCSAF
jgi:hypothetical protein